MKAKRIVAELVLLLALTMALGWLFWPKAQPAPAQAPAVNPLQAKIFERSIPQPHMVVEAPTALPAKKSSNPLGWNWTFTGKNPPRLSDNGPRPTAAYTNYFEDEFKSTEQANLNYLTSFVNLAVTSVEGTPLGTIVGYGPKERTVTNLGLVTLKEGVPTQLRLSNGTPLTITAHQDSNGYLLVQVMYLEGYIDSQPMVSMPVYVVHPDETVNILRGKTGINFSVQVQ